MISRMIFPEVTYSLWKMNRMSRLFLLEMDLANTKIQPAFYSVGFLQYQSMQEKLPVTGSLHI